MRTFGLPVQIGLTDEERTAAAERRKKRQEFHKKMWRRSLEIPPGKAHGGKLEGPHPDIVNADRHRGGSWSLFRRFLWFAKPYYGTAFVVFLLMMITSALEAVWPFGLKYTIDWALPERSVTLLSIIAGALIAAALLRALMQEARERGLKAVEIMADADVFWLRAWYERRGFLYQDERCLARGERVAYLRWTATERSEV